MLVCRLNKCGVISPRYDVKHGDIEAWVARLLPSRLVSAFSYDPHPACLFPSEASSLPVPLEAKLYAEDEGA